MVRIDDQPDRAPHVFVYLRNTPEDADPYDEANWSFADPALDDFLSREAMRAEATRGPQRTRGRRTAFCSSGSTAGSGKRLGGCRCTSTKPPRASRGPHRTGAARNLAGRVGVVRVRPRRQIRPHAVVPDLPAPMEDGGQVDVVWRFWLPEAGLDHLATHLGDDRFDRWTAQGWIAVTAG